MSRETEKAEVRAWAESCLVNFIKLVAPHRVLGAVHEELCTWWERPDGKDNQLVLLPRDHQKSAMIAYRVAHYITTHPDATILYTSATADLAEKQLKFVKDILSSDNYRFYWPEMVNKDVNSRERWTADEFSVDHPLRKKEGVRDPTMKAAGLTANTTGLHCQLAVLDDVVVPNNAYTQLGRDQVKAYYSQLSSIETTGAKEWVVGTRYHPSDLYKDLVEMTEYYTGEDGEDVEVPVYEVFEKQVEVNGEFLWPKQRRHDGKVFGFDERELARKKAKYLDITQFYAQYYNNPNSQENAYIDKTKFQYYDREKLKFIGGGWYFGEELLSIYSGIDFAFSLNEKADYTVIITVGLDSKGSIYILDIDRFKTNRISIMYDHIIKMFRKWNFRKLRAEVTVAQQMIVNQFKDTMRQEGAAFSIDENRPTKNKEERIAASLQPRYDNLSIWHYKGGNCQTLEEELVMEHPEHDDVKDVLASVLEIAVAPMRRKHTQREGNVVYSSRFGGVAA